jgi:hypothetical protein
VLAGEEKKIEHIESWHTFKMEENIRLIVFEHLRHKLDVHILDIDFLQRVSITIYAPEEV